MSDKTFILSEESALSWTKLASGTPMEDHYITENLALTKEAEDCWSKIAATPPYLISPKTMLRLRKAQQNNAAAKNIPAHWKGKTPK